MLQAPSTVSLVQNIGVTAERRHGGPLQSMRMRAHFVAVLSHQSFVQGAIRMALNFLLRFAPALVALALFAAPVTAAPLAQSSGVGTVTGLVTDKFSGAPIAGVYVTVGYNSVKLAAITGSDGRYTVSNVPAGQPADVFGFHGGGYRYHNSIYDDGLHIVLQPGQTYTFNFTVYQLNDPSGEPSVSDATINPQTAAPGQTVTFGLRASGGKGGLSDEVIAASPAMGRMALLSPTGGDQFSGAFTVPQGLAAGDYPFAFFAASNECYDNRVFQMVTLHVAASASPAPQPTPSPAQRYFRQTGFKVDNDAFWNYFNQRGGVATFGYPISRVMTFEGFPTQFFQRQVMQQFPDGSVHLLNLLDPGLLAYTTFNFSTFPAYSAAQVAALPSPGAASYIQAVQSYIGANAPDTWQGLPVNFASTFQHTVSAAQAFPKLAPTDPQVASLLPLVELEIWGVPTSAPAFDPSNHSFVYVRWQRGVMQYDAGCHCTQGVLLADYLKAIITGKNLPADLAAEASGSALFQQYNPSQPHGLNRPDALANTDLTNAFEPQQPS